MQSLDLELAADRLLAELPGHGRRTENIARTDGVSVLMIAMEAGDALEEHSAPGAVTVHILRGHASLSAGAEQYELRPGQLLVIPPAVRHNLRALEQSVALLTISGS